MAEGWRGLVGGSSAGCGIVEQKVGADGGRSRSPARERILCGEVGEGRSIWNLLLLNVNPSLPSD